MKVALIEVRLPVKQKERSERMLLINQKKERMKSKCERLLSHLDERPAKPIGENENRYGDIREPAAID